MTPFWTVVWSFVTTFFGVLLAALIAWEIERNKDEKDAKRRAKNLTQVLVEGLQRNILILRRMRSIAAGDAGVPACPSQALQLGHFSATIVSGVELLEADPEKYGMLLNASYSAAHINRRVELLEDLERMTLEYQPSRVRSTAAGRRTGHYKELVALIDKAEPTFEVVLLYLGGQLPPAES